MAGEAYSKRYGSGGFVDLPAQTTAIDSQFLNAVEAALVRLLGADPTNDCVMVWDATLSPPRFKTIKLVASEISPTAGIAKSQLAPLAITDADIAPGANISASKLNIVRGITRTVYTTGSGTYTPPANVRALVVECLGGGGSGGAAQTGSNPYWACGAGGNGGVYASKLITSPAASYAYAVGAGGAAVAGGGTATSNVGNDTSFGSTLVVAKGGAAGTYDSIGSTGFARAVGSPAPSLAGSVGDIVIPGGQGEMGVIVSASFYAGGGGGVGGGPYGGAGAASIKTNGSNSGGVGASAGAYGGGGGGGVCGNFSGGCVGSGAGQGGLIVITEVY